MSALDFLFEGTPPASTTQYGQTTQNLPQWYSDYTQGLIAKANAIASEPYLTYPGPRIAGFTPDQQTAQQSTRTAQGQFSPWVSQAKDFTAQSGFGSSAGAATPYFQQATNMSPLSAAQPFINAASATTPSDISQYFNPYADATVNRATQLANRNWNEQILPSMMDTFTSGGQYGSSRMADVMARAGRDVTEGLQTNASNLLSGAYESAAGQSAADKARLAGLATTAGGLTASQQNLLSNLGYQTGALTGADLARQLQAGTQLGGLAQLGQSMNYKDIAALDTVGQQQQAMNQANLNLANQDFQAQRDYPKEQVNWLSNILRGQQMPMATQTSQTVPISGMGPSPLEQLTTISDALKGLTGGSSSSTPSGSARGGRIVKKARGGIISPSMMARMKYNSPMRSGMVAYA